MNPYNQNQPIQTTTVTTNDISRQQTAIIIDSDAVRNVSLAALIIAIVAFVGVIIVVAVFATQISHLNNTVNNLTMTVGDPSNTATSIATICNSGTQIPVYIQLVTTGNFAIMSTSLSVNGAMVQLGSAPAVLLCPTPGVGRVPVFSYVSANGDPINNSFGNSSTAPTGQILGNNGGPIGFLFTSQFVSSQVLSPVFLVGAQFNQGGSTAVVMSKIANPVFGGITYTQVSSNAIGFSP
jgi:hypothetical protein